MRELADEAAWRRARVRARWVRGAALLGLAAILAAGLAVSGVPVLGATTTSGSGSAGCGPGTASLSNSSLSVSGDTVTAQFTVAPGCGQTTVSLASYSMVSKPQEYPQTLFDSVTRTVDPGTYTLSVQLPDCYWQADLVTGSVLQVVGPGSLYGVRKAVAKTGGQSLCQTTTATTGTGTTSTGTTSTTTTSTGTTSTSTTPGVVETADVAVTKVPDHPSVFVGQQVTYELTVTNNGPGPALDVMLVDPLPTQETFVSVSNSACTGTTVISCSLGTLAAGDSVAIEVVTLARTPGTAINVATVSTTSPESNTTNNQARASVPIRAAFTPPACAKLTLRHRTVVTGKRTTLLVQVRNQGAPVAGARVDVRGAGISIVRRTDSRGRVLFTLSPHRVGVLRVRLLQAASCPAQLKDVGVRGPFRPPLLTG